MRVQITMPSPDLELIWQSEQVIAVNKPAGLPTQAPGDAESLESRLNQQLQRGHNYLAFPHRLDRVVSGVILAALTKKAARLLSAQFASRKTEKHYRAIVEGCIDLDESWDDYVVKQQDRAMAEVCGASDAGAKRAQTFVKTIQIDESEGVSRLALQPVTGRMHQLRVQAACRGHPIVGDRVYGASKTLSDLADRSDESGRADRILLHAHRLGFHDPMTGRRLQIEAPCPF